MTAARIGRGPATGDAFGQMLLKCLADDRAVAEIVERDDGQIGIADARRYFAAHDQWGPRDHWVLARAAGRVVDVGAGAGRHSLELQERAMAVLALDVSPGAVEVMRRRGVRETYEGSIFRLAAENEGSFDTALLMGNNLGLLESREVSRRWLHALDRLLAPSGRILGIGMDPYATDNEDHLRYHERNRLRGRMGGQIRLRSRFETLATPWFDYLFASLSELRDLLSESPWHIAETCEEGAGYAVELARS